MQQSGTPPNDLVEEKRHLLQRNALIQFTSTGPSGGDGLEDTIRKLTETSAKTLNVARVSVWRYNETHRAIQCLDLYELDKNRHTAGFELSAKDYPVYFKTLAEKDVIVAHDARQDPNTHEFAETYLIPNGITSMLDAPIHLGGLAEGVLCHEHIGPARRWTADEVTFSVAVANVASLALAWSEQKQAEARIRDQAALLDAAREAIYVQDLDDQIIYWNKGAELIYGWAAGESTGCKPRDLFYKDVDVFREARAILLKQGEWQGDVVQRTKSGRDIVMDVRWTLVTDKDGKPKSILVINTDITEKKNLESQILRSQRMESIGTLAGGIAHDLNNMLTPVLMSIDMLHTLVKDDAGRSLITTLHDNVRRAADLVKQVLSFARGVEGKRLVLEPSRLIHDLVKVLEGTFPKSIDVCPKTSSGLWKLTGDPTQMHQVFLNLCLNARDAMPEGGKLTISVENVVVDEASAAMNLNAMPGAFVIIQVEDTGSGMPRSVRERIFDPFFTTKEFGQGTGLGLSTALSIIKSHGGFINVYSEPGEGSVFKVYLPANTSEIPADIAELETTRFPRGEGECILLVDDEESIRNIARHILEQYGYRVMVAENGAEAIALYAMRQSEIDLVLTDMSMPVMDGPSTINALKTLNATIPVIGSSGLSSHKGSVKATGISIDGFLTKPYTAETLLKIVHEVLHPHSDSLAQAAATH